MLESAKRETWKESERIGEEKREAWRERKKRREKNKYLNHFKRRRHEVRVNELEIKKRGFARGSPRSVLLAFS
jgi:hypothetical protein